MTEILVAIFFLAFGLCIGIGLGWQACNRKQALFMVQGWDRLKERLNIKPFVDIEVEDVGESWSVEHWKETKWWSPWEKPKDH